eukprot:scaffold494_cov245-Pinguiococcus_pyrenoidosus.AAC.13
MAPWSGRLGPRGPVWLALPTPCPQTLPRRTPRHRSPASPRAARQRHAARSCISSEVAQSRKKEWKTCAGSPAGKQHSGRMGWQQLPFSKLGQAFRRLLRQRPARRCEGGDDEAPKSRVTGSNPGIQHPCDRGQNGLRHAKGKLRPFPLDAPGQGERQQTKERRRIGCCSTEKGPPPDVAMRQRLQGGFQGLDNPVRESCGALRRAAAHGDELHRVVEERLELCWTSTVRMSQEELHVSVVPLSSTAPTPERIFAVLVLEQGFQRPRGCALLNGVPFLYVGVQHVQAICVAAEKACLKRQLAKLGGQPCQPGHDVLGDRVVSALLRQEDENGPPDREAAAQMLDVEREGELGHQRHELQDPRALQI